jgi:Tol biopolymer transport system component
VRALLLIVLGFALASTAPAAHAAYPGGNGRIAFGESGVVASVKPDGSDYQVHATGTEPTWSPTGNRLAFTSPIPTAITLVNADGSGRRNVTQRGQAKAATWSPDGEQLAVRWWTEGVDCQGIATTRLDGTESRHFTPPPDRVSTCPDDLQWSPTGDRIAFSGRPRNSGGSSDPAEIFTIEDRESVA